MKRIIILTTAALIAAVSCSNAPKLTNAEKVAAFEQNYQSLIDDYRSAVDSLEGDNEAISALAEATQAKLDALCIETVKNNPSDSVALDALDEVRYSLEDAELEELVNVLSDEMKATDKVQSILKGLEAKKNTKEGMMFTDFTIVQDENNPEASTVKLSDYVGKGKYILADFWASWCGPCKRELPNIANVYNTYKGENFDVLSIAVWDKVEDTKQAAPELGIVWNQIINGQKIPTDIYGIDGIPHLILFGPDGTIVRRGIRGEEIGKAVKESLGL